MGQEIIELRFSDFVSSYWLHGCHGKGPDGGVTLYNAGGIDSGIEIYKTTRSYHHLIFYSRMLNC